MRDKNHEQEEHELPLRKRSQLGSAVTDGNGRNNHLLESSSARGLHFTTTPILSDSRNPGSPGIFFESQITVVSVPTIMNSATDIERYIAEFHDSDSGDIFDLYNACNGVVHDGFLDIRKLDELSNEEREVLNVERLREIWLHTTSGCPNCAGIISTLNSVRGMVADDKEAPLCESRHPIDDKPH
jgi:hypothetical protein